MFRNQFRQAGLYVLEALGMRRWAMRNRWLLDSIYYGFFHALDVITGRARRKRKRRAAQRTDWRRASVILMSYQHEPFVAEAVKSALDQDYPNLEILISDDRSTDGSVAIIRDIISAYDGPHDVYLTVNEVNTNIRHLNYAVPATSGTYVVLACSDDVMAPNRVRALVEEMEETGASLAGSNATVVDVNGQPLGLYYPKGKPPTLGMRDIILDQHVFPAFGASIAFHRDVWDVFGNLKPGLQAVDMILPFRGLLLNGLCYVDDPLLKFRWHSANASVSRVHTTAKNDKELGQMLAVLARSQLVTMAAMRETLDEFTAARYPLKGESLEDLHRMFDTALEKLKIED